MWELVKKDLLLEWRTREVLAAVLLMGVLTLLVLSFAFDPTSPQRTSAAPGAFWVAFLFAAVYGFGRAFAPDERNDAWQGLLLSPLDRGTLYLAKVTSTLVYLLVAAATLIVLFVVLFDVELTAACWPWFVATGLAALGLSALGTIFSAVSIRTRAREIMLPLLLLPLVVPLFLGGVEVTQRSLQGQALGDAVAWLHLMVGFDIAALVVAWLLFEYVVEQ
ncbi:MAG: heme exporter protein CcmB [Candidatus Binatia bacterium]|nr:heme exporter protein CcmB [Candidatus Binatia bacterium]